MPAPQPAAGAAPAPRSGRLVPRAVVIAGVLFGLLCGAFEITNTSIGWHIASGRWMIEHREILDHDPFSFTAQGAEWLDHEWLFQVLAAGLVELGGVPLLVVMRMVIMAVLMVLLIRISVAGGLDPVVACVLSALCLLGARPRFFVRPELFTLLLVPLALWLFADREGRRWWPLTLAAVVAVGANLHGGILIAPVLIAVWFAGEVLDQLLHRPVDLRRLSSGALGLVAAGIAPVLNPHGAAIWTVPFRLAEMVRQPHIPNPEWVSPTPAAAPAFYLAMVVVVAALAVGCRAPQNWATTAAAAALALKHIRNVGLFFVLLPQTVATVLARWSWFAADPDADGRARSIRRALCLTLVGVLAAVAVARPWPRAGFGFADHWYPDRAFDFLVAHGLADTRLYNDVRFGGWLILRGDPGRRVFLDDRNEIHEPLLREIWDILQRSDVTAWQALLDRWRIDTVMLRYHEPFRVTTPAGVELGRRGFSTLWFAADRWALVYWDDVAMILVRRSPATDDLVAEREYRLIHPDDLDHVIAILRDDPSSRPTAAAELERALRDDPGCRRARDLAAWLEALES